MGTSSSTKETITNILKDIVTQTNQQLVKIVSQSSVNVSSHILQTQKAKINSTSDASNIISIYNVIINGGTVSLEQANDLKLTVGSILNIVQNNDMVTSISTQIQNDVMSQVNQSAALSAQVNAAASITKQQQTDGEIDTMASALADSLNSIFGSSTQSETDITSTIISKINETSLSSTDIEQYVSTIIDMQVTQDSINKCLQSNTVFNAFYDKNIVINGGTFTANQSNILNNMFSCFVSSQMSSSDIQNIASGILDQSIIKGGQGTSVVDQLSDSLSQLSSTLAKSFMDNIQYIIIAVVICVIIGGIIVASSPFLLKYFKKTSLYKKMSYEPPSTSVPESVPVPVPKIAGPSTNNSKLSTAVKNYKKMRVTGNKEMLVLA
jgi:hypothetical protein